MVTATNMFGLSTKKAEIAEVQINPSSRFEEYGNNVEKQIDLAQGFGSDIIKNPGSFGYSSSQTTMDVLDQRMMVMQKEAGEFIRDELLRPLAESWDFKNFDDMDVEITFVPTVRRLTLEDIIALPKDAVSPLEVREMLKEENILLDDDLYNEFIEAQRQIADLNPSDEIPAEPKTTEDEDDLSDIDQPNAPATPGTTPERPPNDKNKPMPVPVKKPTTVEYLLRNPNRLVEYIDKVTDAKVKSHFANEKYLELLEEEEAEERYGLSPQGTTEPNKDDKFKEQDDKPRPEITNPKIAKRMTGKLKKIKNKEPETLNYKDPQQSPDRITTQANDVSDAIKTNRDKETGKIQKPKGKKNGKKARQMVGKAPKE